MKNIITDYDINKILKYRMAIIGEIHSPNMIPFYDKLLAKKRPKYFICEFADMDRVYTRENLYKRMQNATNGDTNNYTSHADFQYNYDFYELAYKYDCILIGCNPVKPKLHKFNRMHDEDLFREPYMLNTIREFEGENVVVQLGDHHLRSIPITNEFLDFTNTHYDNRGVYSVNDLTVNFASPVWNYFINRSDTCICRVNDEYNNELKFINKKNS